ncbi:MFS transporter [Vibrio sp. S4M6]|uniref:MFS transporter n=1 Tax=Vibrio sinus TaxID=2946865 RepID=UPI00202A2D27|nr:MFS transporter [Vibrio sinus]MCL9783172.1 MFS transporter [Vibrio sinus]
MIEHNTQDYKRVVISLALGSFLIFCNLYYIQPILPLLSHSFSVSETKINWIFAASTLALSVCLVPWAICSESYGRRKIMLFGLFMIPLVGVMLVLGNSFYTLIISRALMGIAIAAFASVAVAYMVEELAPSAFSHAIGIYIAANSLGGVAGRVLGGTLTEWLGWKQAALYIAVLSFIGALLVVKLLPQQKQFKPQKGLFFYHNRAIVKHLANTRIWFAMLIGGANFAIFVNVYTVMGFRLVNPPHNLSIGFASLIFLCYLAGTLSSSLSGKWCKSKHPIHGIILGAIITLFGIWVAYFDTMPTMILSLLLVSLGGFFTHTLAYSWVSQNAHEAKATATALYLVHYYIGGSLGGFLLLFCWQSWAWTGVLFGGSALIAIIIFLSAALLKLNSSQQKNNYDIANVKA